MENTTLTDQEKLNYRRYFIFWIGQNISLIGSATVQFILTWWITIATENPIYLSLGLFLTFFPRIVFSPLAGVLADKMDKKKLIIITDTAQALTTFFLIILVWNKNLNIWLVLGFNGIRAIFQSFHGPAASTVTPLMVPKSKLSKVNSLSQMTQAIIDMIAPILGAVLMQSFQVQYTLFIDIITFLIAIILLVNIKIPKIESKKKENNIPNSFNNKIPNHESVLKQYVQGIKTIRKHPGLSSLFVAVIITNFLLSPFNVLITFFINVIHEGNEWNMVFISVVINVGMIIGAIIPSLRSEWKHKTALIFSSLGFLFIGIFLFSMAPQGNFVWMGISSFVITFLLPIAMTINMFIIQTTIPVEKMGRVMAFFSALNSAVMLLGYLISGPLATLLGVINLFKISSAIGLVIIIMLYLFSSAKELDQITSEEKEGENEIEDDVKYPIETFPETE